jgi:hypothetical protein
VLVTKISADTIEGTDAMKERNKKRPSTKPPLCLAWQSQGETV